MRLQWIRDLALLAETGSFSAAAQRANSSQPAFSRRIQALETWVGAPLADRGRIPVRLSAAGEQILEAGLQAMSRLEIARQQVRESLAQPDRYMVTFAAQHSIGWRFYPQWLQQFESDFGPILSRLRADNLPDCFADLVRGSVDLVMAYDIAPGAPLRPPQGTQSLVIGRDRLVPVSKTGSDGRPIFTLGPADASHEVPYLRFGSGAPLGWQVEAVVKATGLARRLKPIYENAMSGALRMRVREGLGLAWLPLSLIEPDIEAGLMAHAGDERHGRELVIRLHRIGAGANPLIERIWNHLAAAPAEASA
ncbi:MAG: LysR family transcriptional regulator [Burkholderiaceae bacterium]